MQKLLRKSRPAPRLPSPVVQTHPSGISGLSWYQGIPQTARGARRVIFSSPEHASQLATAAPVDSNLFDNECIVCRSAGDEDNDAEVALKTPTEVCTHPPQVCVGCLQQVILAAVTSGDFITGIQCPSYNCPQRMGYHDIQKWAAKEVFDRYDKLLLQDSLRTDGRYVFCVEPSCTAGQEHTGGENNNIVTCYHCGTKQCFRHQIPWHEGITCEQWDEQQKTITNQQEQKTEDWIYMGTKVCPGVGCGRRIQKSSGCDHMTCKRPGGCGHQFCWECLAPWLQIMSEDNSRHYDSCKYYSGRPGENPAPPEIVAARTVLAPPPPLTPPNPAPEPSNPLFHRPQPLRELVLPHVAQRRELLARRVRAASRTTEIQASMPTTTPNATLASSSTEPSGSRRMPTIPTISEPSSSSSLPTYNANLISHGELRTVSQIRNAAAMKTNKSVKGAAPLTAMSSLQRLAAEAHYKEKAGDLRGALFQFVQVGVLLQFVQESHEYKQEARKGRHGALYQLMQEFNRGPFEAMMKSVYNIQQTLLKAEQVEADRLFVSSDIAATAYGESSNRRFAGTLADRLRQLQGTSTQGVYIQQSQDSSLETHWQGSAPVPREHIPETSANQRHPLNISFPISSPTPPPNGRQVSNPTIGFPIASAIPAGTSPRQFVPISSFGPPSPTHSTGSSTEEDDIQVPRVHCDPPLRAPSDFFRTFPPIDELNERDPTSMFSAVPTHASGADKPMTPLNGPHLPHKSNGIPWKGKQFDLEPPPAGMPIPIKRLSPGNRPQTPTHFLGSPGHVQAHQSTPTVDFPITSVITPRKLNSLLETRGLNILLVDVRGREDFERERINHDAIVCLEPLVLTRPGINSSMIEGAQVISPFTEQVLFKNRSRFDLIVIYDDRSTSLGHAMSPMSVLSRSIFEKEFHRPLKRPPMVLVGGLRAWKADIGDDGLRTLLELPLPSRTEAKNSRGGAVVTSAAEDSSGD